MCDCPLAQSSAVSAPQNISPVDQTSLNYSPGFGFTTTTTTTTYYHPATIFGPLTI